MKDDIRTKGIPILYTPSHSQFPSRGILISLLTVQSNYVPPTTPYLLIAYEKEMVAKYIFFFLQNLVHGFI